MFKKAAGLLVTLWLWFYIAIVTVVATFPIGFCSVFLAPFDPQRRLAHQFGTYWGQAVLLGNPFWKLKIIGRENIDHNKNYVIISNHTSLADIIVLYSLNMQFKWMAKSSLFQIPFLGWSMSFMKYVALERGKHGSIRESYTKVKEWLNNGMSILIFPEGTRSPTGTLGEFKNGAFKLAVESGIPILPIALSGNQQAIGRGQAKFGAKVQAILKVLPPIPVTKDMDPEKLKEKTRTLLAQELNAITT